MLDRMYLRVAKVLTFSGERRLANATGFFYLQDRCLYLVTSRHVVVCEGGWHRPDRLQVSLHSSVSDLQERSELSIPLFLDGVPQWHQHPTANAADVVAVEVNDPHVLSNLCVSTFVRDDILSRSAAVPLGQDVLILGFPLGFHDTVHNLPIVRRATLASSFAHPFRDEPYFLTDARLHRGMSGSPVILLGPGKSQANGTHEPDWQLLGVHSSSLDVSDRDRDQDEPLGLNAAWYASLIPEILPRRSMNHTGVPSSREWLP